MLIESLTLPEAYPHAPAAVEVRQTHASVLFFAGDLVYKVKKPVNLGFLDFSTLQRRRHFCEEEVRLNSRLAPDMYLGVAPITRGAAGALHIRGDGPPVEFAVEMRRLPADRMLDHLLAIGAAGKCEIDAIARTLAAFHAQAATGPGVDEHGTSDAVARHLRRNLEQLRPFAGNLPDDPSPRDPVLSLEMWRHLDAWIRGRLTALRPLLEQRVREHRIRDGHGDLHAGNICMHGPADEAGTVSPVIYDCIEFDPALRCGDVASDLAFLAMDLDRRERRDLSARLIERYSALSGDTDLGTLQPLYRAHFALVRAKVTAIRARDTSLDPREQEAARRDAAAYTHLAIGYTLPPSVIIMMGLPATGKSWMAQQLAAPIGGRVLRSDEIRKQLAGLPPSARPAGPDRDRLYSADMTARTYAEMHTQAAAALAAGASVVLDATHPTRELRRAAIDLAGRCKAPWIIIHTTAPEPIIRDRMAARALDADEVSDADLAVYLKARDRFQPPTEVAPPRLVETSPAIAPETALARALEGLTT